MEKGSEIQKKIKETNKKIEILNEMINRDYSQNPRILSYKQEINEAHDRFSKSFKLNQQKYESNKINLTEKLKRENFILDRQEIIINKIHKKYEQSLKGL